MLAIRIADQFVQELGFSQFSIEGNSEIVINPLRHGAMSHSSFGHLIKDTLFFFQFCTIISLSHIVRQCNVVAHTLTWRAKLFFPLLIWMEFVPPNINNVVIADLPAH